MKNIYKYIVFTVLAGSLLAFAGCDVNDDFDNFKEETGPQNIITKEVSMTPDLYTQMVGLLNKDTDADAIKFFTKNNAFSETYSADKYAIALIKNLYPTADVPSSANLHYKYILDPNESVTKYVGKSHTVTKEEYEEVWKVENAAQSFTPRRDPNYNVPKLLAKAYTDPVDGEIKNVNYFISENEPYEVIAEGDKYLSEDFEGENPLDNWTNVAVEGTKKVWDLRDYKDNHYANISSFNSGEINDVYLISKKLALSNTDGLYLSFYVTIGHYKGECLSVLVSENYTGSGDKADIAAATWTDITSLYTIPKEPTSGFGSSVHAGHGKIDQFKGKEVYIAFRYNGDGTDNSKTTTIQLDNISVFDGTVGYDVDGKELEYATYIYDESTEKWAEHTSNYDLLLQPADYELMGERNPYFYTDEVAKNKLPVYLKDKFPYAQEGNSYIVVYYNSKDNCEASEYIMTSGEWKLNQFEEQRSSQFVRSIDGWVFDPTLQIDINDKDAYMVIINYVIANQALENGDLVHANKNAEYYYGFSSYYVNVSYRDKDRSFDPLFPAKGTNEEKAAFMDKRTYEGLIVYLSQVYPDAKPEVSGIKQHAKIRNVKIYSNPVSTYENELFTYEFQYLKEGKWMVLSRQSQDDASNFTEYNKPEE